MDKFNTLFKCTYENTILIFKKRCFYKVKIQLKLMPDRWKKEKEIQNDFSQIDFVASLERLKNIGGEIPCRLFVFMKSNRLVFHEK